MLGVRATNIESDFASNALEAYQKVHQGGDSLVDFDRKYRNTVSQLETSGIKLEPELHALDFLKKLNSNYGDLLCDVLNGVKPAPESVEMAYQMADRLVVKVPARNDKWTNNAASEVAMAASIGSSKKSKGNGSNFVKSGAG